MKSAGFEYYRAHTISEAIEMFAMLESEGKSPLFFNGGTEIITMRRINVRYTDARAVIDIKGIPECAYTGFQRDRFVIGASVSLARLEETIAFPLLAKNSSRIADHTSREKITIGGNICGNIQYKEAVLPLLLTDCELMIANKSGVDILPIHQVFDQQINLAPGSFITQILVPEQFLEAPFVSKKITRMDRIGYPLVTVSALKAGNWLRVAFSGVCGFPFRHTGLEVALNDQRQSVKQRIATAVNQLPAPVLDDLEGSASYRLFVLRNVLEETLIELEGNERHGTISRIDD